MKWKPDGIRRRNRTLHAGGYANGRVSKTFAFETGCEQNSSPGFHREQRLVKLRTPSGWIGVRLRTREVTLPKVRARCVPVSHNELGRGLYYPRWIKLKLAHWDCCSRLISSSPSREDEIKWRYAGAVTRRGLACRDAGQPLGPTIANIAPCGGRGHGRSSCRREPPLGRG